MMSVKARKERRNWTELKEHNLVFDELTNGQFVILSETEPCQFNSGTSLCTRF